MCQKPRLNEMNDAFATMKYSTHFLNFYFFSHAAILAAIFGFSSVSLLTG